MGKVVKGIGSVLKTAAPIVGMIPGVGTIPAALMGGVGGLASGGGLKGALGGAAMGAAGGLGGGLLSKAGTFGKIGGLLGKAGKTGIGQSILAKIGGLSGQQLLGGGLGLAQVLGQRSQRKAAERRDAAMDEARNQLLSRILQPQTYNFQPGA